MTGLRQILRNSLPDQCVFCSADIRGRKICDACMKLLPWNENVCERCGQGVPTHQPAGVPCVECQAKLPLYRRARAPLLYSFPIDMALKSMKFRRQLTFVPAFANLLLPVLERDFRHRDALVPVPLHRWRHAWRGFNQATELCRPLARRTGLPIVQNVRRTRRTESQTGLDAVARRKNLAGAFTVKGRLRCKYPLIVDDVMTTGATCGELAKALLDAGAREVNVLTVARAVGG